MDEKTVKLSNGKEYIIKEVKYKDMVANTVADDKEAAAKFLIQKASGMTDEEFDDLGMKDGLVVQQAVNEVNGLDESFLRTAPPEISS